MNLRKLLCRNLSRLFDAQTYMGTFAAFFTLAAASLFSQYTEPLPKASYLSSRTIPEGPAMVPGYNAPSRIDVRSSWEVYITGSFLYWNPREEGLQLGHFEANDAVGNNFGEVLDMKFPYKMGYKAGLGIHTQTDNWDTYVEYTWFHMKHRHAHENQPGTIFPDWFLAVDAAATFIRAEWELNMDMFDAELARCFYVGTCLTFRPYFGGRLAFIKQHYSVTSDPVIYTFNIGQNALSKAMSNSWGLGPRAGLNASYLMRYGLRVFGNANAYILYTPYRTVIEADQLQSPGLITKFIEKVALLRPNFDMNLGLGWGVYYCGYRYHLDLAASYDYQVFWNQNMMRHLNDSVLFGLDGTYGNLYLQGLTFTARLDF